MHEQAASSLMMEHDRWIQLRRVVDAAGLTHNAQFVYKLVVEHLCCEVNVS